MAVPAQLACMPNLQRVYIDDNPLDDLATMLYGDGCSPRVLAALEGQGITLALTPTYDQTTALLAPDTDEASKQAFLRHCATLYVYSYTLSQIIRLAECADAAQILDAFVNYGPVYVRYAYQCKEVTRAACAGGLEGLEKLMPR